MSADQVGVEEAAAPPRWAPPSRVGDRIGRAVGMQLLIVDPCEAGQDTVRSRLGAEGVGVIWCPTALGGLIEFGRLDPGAVIVAPLLDGVDPVDFVRALTCYGSRVVLAGLDPDAAQAAGPLFLAGATAAVARPYDPDEIIGRLHSHIADLDERARMAFGDIELDPRAYEVRLAGEVVSGLPLKEFELLRVLMVHANNLVDTETIRESLWGDVSEAPSSNAIAVHAARLRTRLGDHARLSRVRGRGYRLSLG